MIHLLIRLAFCGMLLGAPLAAVAEPPAPAASGEGCDRFLWPLETERAWFKASESVVLASGDRYPAPPDDKAVTLRLKPAKEVTLAAEPTGTPKPEHAERFAGVAHFDGLPEGHYQVALSDHGWIDVVQDGKALEATAHTGSPHCDALRKSVRFELGSGPFAVQVNAVSGETIRFAIRPAAD